MPLINSYQKSKLEPIFNPIAITVENISKFYRIPRENKTTVYENILGLFDKRYRSYDEFWALKDVSFKVNHGETFGIIGPNGSGKSTLLKMLAGVIFTDSGQISINGRIAPFLELGVGFQPELTAKENVYLYGAIMGLSKGDLSKRYDEIMAFSELKRFENMRLKNFSSGMIVRLAFATAIQVNPDIFLVDEALSVGDEAFQKKCFARFEEIMKSGKTIVLVSHDLSSIRRLCKKTLVLNKGHVEFIGDTAEALDVYHNMVLKTGGEAH